MTEIKTFKIDRTFDDIDNLYEFIMEDVDFIGKYCGMTFNSMIRQANKMGLLLSNLEKWDNFRQKRNLTSHTYNEKTAQEVVSIIEDFSKEVKFLLNKLKERLMFGLEKKYLDFIINVLKQNISYPNAKFYIFGSRAKGNHEEYSDVDIAVDLSGEKIATNILGKILTESEDSTLSYEVDVIDLNDISESFRSFIENDLIEL